MQPGWSSLQGPEGLDSVLALCASCRHPTPRPWPSRPKAPLARSLLAAPMLLHTLAQAPCAWGPPSTSCSGRPAPAAPLPPRLLGQRRRQTAAAAGAGEGQPHPEESERPQGDSKLQDSLVNQLQFEIGKKRVRGSAIARRPAGAALAAVQPLLLSAPQQPCMLPDHCAQASPSPKVEEFVEEEAEGLKAKAEEAKEELDKLADLQNLRAEVAFNSALAGKSTRLHKVVCGSCWASGATRRT